MLGITKMSDCFSIRVMAASGPALLLAPFVLMASAMLVWGEPSVGGRRRAVGRLCSGLLVLLLVALLSTMLHVGFSRSVFVRNDEALAPVSDHSAPPSGSLDVGTLSWLVTFRSIADIWEDEPTFLLCELEMYILAVLS